MSNIITYDGFKNLLRRAQIGQTYLYHQGELARAAVFREDVRRIRLLVQALYDLGAVRLYQKRGDDMQMGYYLVVTEKFRSGRGADDSTIQEAERLYHAL